jgi:hypothetical protein
MVAGVGIEPTTRGFSKFHRQLIRKYFNHLSRRNLGATQVRQASIFIFDGAFQALARRNFEVECRLNDNWSLIESSTVDASGVVESPSAPDRSVHQPFKAHE